MNFTRKKVCHELHTTEPVENLIKILFPPEEQNSIDYLLQLAKNPMVHFWAYYCEDVFCGMTYVVESDDTLFGLYLAVSPEFQSKGCGTAIINDTKASFPGKDLVIHVEDPNQTAPNQEQRRRRIKLYEKLGFKDTGYRINGTDTVFCLMSTADCFKIESYMKLMHDYSYGEYTPQVYTAEN